ncbi:hypothetical protein [Sediminicoccus sp. BL-A-41-H5]|uniref:hypothetical protein n=1 Tax=Sediminicoccus sp. BL-A-41-H5 TaxID=3421106 RepID=UPI003D6767F2
MNIILIGNSHVVALKEAAAFPGCVSYFYAPGGNLREVVVEDGRLMGANERVQALLSARSAIPGREVQDHVVLADYDAFVVVGLGLSAKVVADAYATVRLWPHIERGKTLVSEPCLEEILIGRIRRTGAFQLAKSLRLNVEKPIFVVPQPSPLEGFKTIIPKGGLQRSAVKLWRPCQIMAPTHRQ